MPFGFNVMFALPLFLLLAGDLRVSACSFANSGLQPPGDEIHRHLSGGSTYPVLPRSTSTENGAFVTNDLQRPLQALTGNNKPLWEVLGEFAAKTGEDLCYWSFQGLPPPRGGPSLLHPFRGYYDVADGHNDQDIEWVQAYGETAVSRLHSRITKDGPVVGTMCAMGAACTARQCVLDPSNKKCIPAVTNGSLNWPMAVSMFKIGHPDLEAAVQDWRGNAATGHSPNIQWDMHAPGTVAARPWNGSIPKPGEISPTNYPHAPWTSSKDAFWGEAKKAKVLRCSDIPAKFVYNTQDLYYCDHMPNATSHISSADEAYAAWKSMKSLWPPSKPCADDQAALDAALQAIKIPQLVGSNCSVVLPFLQKTLTNFNCDNAQFFMVRNVCCSVCGGQPIPDVPAPAPSPPSPTSSFQCSVCNHIYDADRDGAGRAFADLPDSWVCPVCGVPKSAYNPGASQIQVKEVNV